MDFQVSLFHAGPFMVETEGCHYAFQPLQIEAVLGLCCPSGSAHTWGTAADVEFCYTAMGTV